MICEFSTPTWPPFQRLYGSYLAAALPKIAALVSSNPAAYRYLAESIQGVARSAEAGRVGHRGRLAPGGLAQRVRGIVALHRARL